MSRITVPLSPVQPVSEILHGVSITDPYRWLEDQNSPETRAWIAAQTAYARSYLDNIPGRDCLRERVLALLDVETFDSFLKCGNRYFFRKRRPGEEQPSIYMRDTPGGEDQLLIDPASRGTGPFTSVKPLHVSPDGSLLLYEVKQGGERSGTFEILDTRSRRVLPDGLPHGHLRGFSFTPDCKSFYYVHQATEEKEGSLRAAFHHVLGTERRMDKLIFHAGEGEKLRLVLVSSVHTLGFLVHHVLGETYTDFYLSRMGSTGRPVPILRDADYTFVPSLVPGRILAATNYQAPHWRIVDVQPRKNQNPFYFDLVPENEAPITHWTLTEHHIAVSRVQGTHTRIHIFEQSGKRVGEIPSEDVDTVRIAASSPYDDELLVERQSFTRPIEILRYSASLHSLSPWNERSVALDSREYGHVAVQFSSQDGTRVPMFLVGRHNALTHGVHPVVMTSYGGYGIAMTPQFSVLVALLLERGAIFALPNIRGGSEFGEPWHEAARRDRRQVSFDDFLSAAWWLVATGRTVPAKLAIFGGSHAGLLVAAAMTQHPELFRAVLCMVPLLDMLRYHLFDGAHISIRELGTAEDAQDFAALSRYSPYHAVRDGTAYPAVMMVSGDADQNCNPLHARKMTARLQAANSAETPIFLDYSPHRGHSPVLPLHHRIDALTDRLAFLSDQLGLCF